MPDKVDGWWPSEPQGPPTFPERTNSTDEAAYAEYCAGRLSRDEYTLVLNKNMARKKDWGTQPE